MKKYIILTGLMLLGLTSCYQSVLDPLQGIFTAPTLAEMTQVLNSSSAKQDGKRLFTLDLGDGTTTLHATLVGDAYYLTASAYTEADAANAKKGNFILGETSVNGTPVKSGTITITQDGENYTLNAVLFLADGTPYKISWAGTIHYNPDPEPVLLTELLIAQANANGTVTVKLGTDGMGIDAMGTPTGDGFALTADIYSADGFLHDGVYNAAATSDAVGPGEYAPGYEYDLSAWGMGIMHWGTCWWAGDQVTHITSGAITVEQKGANWTITWGDESTYPNWAVFTGAIEALTPSGAPAADYTYAEVLGDAVDNTFAPVAGVKTHSLTVSNKAGEEVAWFDLVLTEGATDLAGEYTVTEYAHEDHTAGNGYDLSAYGWGVGGCRYMKDGALVLIEVGDKVNVANLGGGVYEISGNGYDFVVGPAGGTGGDEFDGTVLTQFMGAADYTGYGINLAGVDLGTAGITVTPGDWGNTYGGDGNYLKLEFYSTDGKLAAGEYSPCAEGGNVGEGEFGIGYDGMFGASGTTWYTMAGGVPTAQYVTDGHLKVEVSGDVYTITLTSSVINAKYVGKLSAE